MAGRSISRRDTREICTNIDDEYLAWRFGIPMLAYRVIDDGDSVLIVRARKRGLSKELAVDFELGDELSTQRLATRVAKKTDCSYVLRIGHRNMSTGFIDLPGGGPTLTWRAVNDGGLPPLANWGLSLGDVELF